MRTMHTLAWLNTVLFSLTILGLLVPTSMTMAGVLLPNPASGSPHKVGPVNYFTVSLTPDPAEYMSTCPWLLPAAQTQSQPYNNAQNIWNFNYATTPFNGTFNLTKYGAYNDGTLGGADFSITYNPGAGDPNDGDVRWIQVIDTDKPSSRGTTYGVAGTVLNGIPLGDTAYLDNAGPSTVNLNGGPPIDPYYGWLTATDPTDITTSTAANANGFSDEVRLPLVNGFVWEAQAFLASETDTTNLGVTTHDVTIDGGVWWGFQDTTTIPEPATILLLSFGGLALLRKRRAM
jgi:hypothetical protein